MDPAIEAFLDRLDNTLKAQNKAIAEIQASTAKIDDLVNWRPDLEKRVSDLGGSGGGAPDGAAARRQRG